MEIQEFEYGRPCRGKRVWRALTAEREGMGVAEYCHERLGLQVKSMEGYPPSMLITDCIFAH